jgi:hypothetical protein
MTTFNQQGQQVTYQYNAGGDINIGAVQDRAGLVRELGKLRGELDQAAGAGVVETDVATEAGEQLDKAVQQAEKPTPNKNVLVGYLTTAQELVKDAMAATGLVAGLVQAIEKARVLF